MGGFAEKDQPPEAAIDQPATENGAEGRGNDGGDAKETQRHTLLGDREGVHEQGQTER